MSRAAKCKRGHDTSSPEARYSGGGCRECTLTLVAAYYRAHREERKAYGRAHALANRAARTEQDRAWRWMNPDKETIKSTRYRANRRLREHGLA